MYDQESPLWMKGLKLPAWTSFLTFFLAMILFFTAFFGHSWYVTPRECQEPLNTYQQSQSRTCNLKFGLFWLCHRGECRYNLKVDYMVVNQLSYLEIQQAYEKYLEPVATLMIISFIGVCFAGIMFLVFLSAFELSMYFGFAAAGIQILTGIMIIVGCSLFGNMFRGPTDSLPFGWSFWMAIVAACMMLINGVFIAFIAMAAFIKHNRIKGRDTPLTQRFGFLNRQY